MPKIQVKVGKVVVRLRKRLHMRQSDLASLAGIMQPNLSKIEKGVSVPRFSTLRKLADALGVDYADLVTGLLVMEPKRKLRSKNPS